MIPQLRHGRVVGGDRERLRAVLRSGPWCWPDPCETSALANARRLSGLSEPPPPAVGACLGVSVVERTGASTLWLLHSDRSIPTHAELHRSAQDSWRAAALALPRAVPLVWSSLRAATSPLPRLTWIATHCPGGVALHEETVRGGSLGLAFALLLASRLTGLPLAGDVMASVAIDPEGRVGDVGALELKWQAVTEFAPAVSRLLVASSQADEAGSLRAGRLEVVPVGNVGEALDVVFGNRLACALADAGRDPGTRGELTRAFFDLAIGGRDEFVDWTPVQRAATAALEWPGLSEGQRYRLEFAGAIAARHERNEGPLSIPPVGWLDAWPGPIRHRVVANLVQHAADTGRPEPAEVLALAARFRPSSIPDAFREQLEVEGAVARLDAVCGRPDHALASQRLLAWTFLRSLRAEDVSYPLSELYRLAGALGRLDAFDEAERLREATAKAGGFGLEGDVYVILARARSLVSLGRTQGAEPSTTLSELATSASVPSHVRWSAARWLLQLVDLLDRAVLEEVSSALAAAAADPDLERSHNARVHAALVELDRAVQGHDVEGEAMALETLRALERGVVGHLERAAGTSPAGAYVARFYPY